MRGARFSMRLLWVSASPVAAGRMRGKGMISMRQWGTKLGAGLLLVPWKPVAALLVIGATAGAPRVQQALSARALVFLGRVSFGLYLIHIPLFCSLGCGLYLALCRGLGWSHAAGSLLAGISIGIWSPALTISL